MYLCTYIEILIKEICIQPILNFKSKEKDCVSVTISRYIRSFVSSETDPKATKIKNKNTASLLFSIQNIVASKGLLLTVSRHGNNIF